MMDFSRSSTHKAKKPHKCFLCGGEIAIGEKYERYTGKYDGDFFDQCFHENCIAILDKFCRDQQDEEYQQDWVSDWLYGRVCDDCPKKESCEENDILKNYEEWDSLAQMALVAYFDKNFNKKLSMNDFEKLKTVTDLMKLTGENISD